MSDVLRCLDPVPAKCLPYFLLTDLHAMIQSGVGGGKEARSDSHIPTLLPATSRGVFSE